MPEHYVNRLSLDLRHVTEPRDKQHSLAIKHALHDVFHYDYILDVLEHVDGVDISRCLHVDVVITAYQVHFAMLS